MRKSYEIEVDCAMCATLFEQTVRKQEGVNDAVVNFMAQKILIDFCEGADEREVIKRVAKACKRAVPGSELYI